MPIEQTGENAKAEFGTYHDVTGNQTNFNVTGTNVNINARDTSRGKDTISTATNSEKLNLFFFYTYKEKKNAGKRC